MFALWSYFTFDTHFPQEHLTITQNINFDYTFFPSKNSFIKIMFCMRNEEPLVFLLHFVAVRTNYLNIFIMKHALELSNICFIFHATKLRTCNFQSSKFSVRKRKRQRQQYDNLELFHLIFNGNQTFSSKTCTFLVHEFIS